MKNIQKNFRTGKIEDQTPEPAGSKRGMETVLRQAFNAGWEAFGGAPTKEQAFLAWLKDVS